jgi:hypothetical protein
VCAALKNTVISGTPHNLRRNSVDARAFDPSLPKIH